MTHIRPARPDDLKALLPLLAQLEGRGLPPERWSLLLSGPFGTDEAPGYVLETPQGLKGFVGVIWARRAGAVLTGNITSWVVDADYRQHSLQLMGPLLERQDVVLTNLTPNSTAEPIFTAWGFTPLSAHTLMFPHTRLSPFRARGVKLNDIDDPTVLPDSEQKIFSDHAFDGVFHVMLKSSQGFCYLLYTLRSVKISASPEKWRRMVYLHHLSHPHVFASRALKHACALMRRHRCDGVCLNDNLISAPVKNALSHPCTMLVRRPTGFSEPLDTLYSELQVLGT